MSRVAMLAVHEPFSVVFLNRLRELGYRQGDNLIFELPGAGANMQFERFPDMAAAIASRHPDVIVAAGSAFVVEALRGAAGQTPVVMIFIDFDPLATGRITSLARPGGTITGLSVQQTDIAGKKVELLQEAAPSARRIAVLFDEATREQLDAAQPAARSLGITLLPQKLSGPSYDYAGAVRAGLSAGARAVLVLSPPPLPMPAPCSATASTFRTATSARRNTWIESSRGRRPRTCRWSNPPS